MENTTTLEMNNEIGELLDQVSVNSFTVGTNLSDNEKELIRSKLEIPYNEEIICFLDKTITSNKKEGFALTDNGIYWKFTSSAEDCRVDGKKSSKNYLQLEDLKSYNLYTYDDLILILENTDIKSDKPMNITIQLESSKLLAAVVKAISTHTLEDVPYSMQRINYYLAKNDDDEVQMEESIIWYKKVFSDHEKSEGKYKLNWSKSSLLFGCFHLFHRKLYIESLAAALLLLILNFLLRGTAIVSVPAILIYLSIMTFLNPYLFYKRFKRVENNIESSNYSEDIKLLLYRRKGSINLLSRAFVFLLSLSFFLGYKIAIIGAIILITITVISEIITRKQVNNLILEEN